MTKTYELRIEPDRDPEAPDQDKGLFLVADIRRHLEVGPPKGVSASAETLAENGYFIFWVRAYVHSGVVLALAESKEASKYPFTDVFDSGTAGFVAVSSSEVPESGEWRDQYHAGKTDRQVAEAIAQGVIFDWNAYLSGDVWGYQVMEITECNLGHTHEDVVDSCWGFRGRDHVEGAGQDSLKFYEDKAKAELLVESAGGV